jgi:ABC-type transporter Mla subunit MlaD
MNVKPTAKVGAVVLLAGTLGYYLYTTLAHIRSDSYLVRLQVTDTQGLGSQSIVRMQGVNVGEVASVDLDKDNQPIIYLAIKKRYRIPVNYRFKITSGILITAAQVQILPPASGANSETKLATDGTAVVKSEPAPTSPLASISPELQQSLTKLNQTFEVVTAKFDDAYKKIDVVLDQTQQLMKTANKIASSTNGVISDPRLKESLIASLQNVKATTDDAHQMTSQLRRDMDDLIGSSKGNLKDLGTKLASLLDHLDGTVQDVNTVVQKLTEQVTDPHLQQSLQDTADLARGTLARFNQIASDIHTLTGDPELQGDLKRSVASLANMTDKGTHAVQKVDQLLGSITGANGKPRVPSLPKFDITASVGEQLNPSRMRIDLNARAAMGKRGLLDFGFYDLGQDTRLNLQAGTRISDKFDLRYGLYASKLGAGLDYQLNPTTSFRADVWDTNRLRLDVRGQVRVNKNASFWIGSDNIFRTPIPMVGVELYQ